MACNSTIGDFIFFFQLTYEGRVIHFASRGRIHSWKDPWVYDATARDLQSGIEVEANHYNTSQEAIDHAVQKLINKLRNEGFLAE